MDLRCLALFQDDFDDIEAPGNAPGFEQFEPGIRAAFDEFLFAAVHGIERPADATRAPGLDFDEKQQLAAACNDVHLTTLGRTVIAIEDFFALRAQPVACRTFAKSPDFLRRPGCSVLMRQTAGRVEQPAETSDDECDKAREDGVHGGAALYHIRCGDQNHIAEIPAHTPPCGGPL